MLIQFLTYLYVLPFISIICNVKGMQGDIAEVFFFSLLCSLSKTTESWINRGRSLFKKSVQGLSHPITHSQSEHHVCVNC